MTTLGALVLVLAAALVGGWILDLIRRGRLYVGYGIVLLALILLVVVVAVVPLARDLAQALLDRLFPSEPVAVVGLAALLLLLIYLLHQLSVLSDRVATLTQELAIRSASGKAQENDPGSPNGKP
jgi:hypothetical protein